MGNKSVEAAQRQVADAEYALENARMVARRKKLAKTQTDVERARLTEAREHLDQAIAMLRQLQSLTRD
jgi:hypothetical protein